MHHPGLYAQRGGGGTSVTAASGITSANDPTVSGTVVGVEGQKETWRRSALKLANSNAAFDDRISL